MNANPEAVLRLASEWQVTESDPLLSEFTRLAISARNASLWMSADGEGIVTLVPSALAGTGLVEVVAQSAGQYASVWAELRTEVLAASREVGFSRLEVIDRHSSLDTDGGRVLGGVRRMKSSRMHTTASGRTSSYHEGDFEEVVALIRTVFAGHPENGNWTGSDVRRRLDQPWFSAEGLRILRENSNLVGFCWCKIHPDGVGEIYLLAVLPEYAGEGHGRDLVLDGVNYLNESGCTELIVYTAVANEAALNLYSSVGFATDRIERRIEILLG